MMNGLVELARETRPTIKVPTCSECGISYHPLYEKKCEGCGGGLVVMECPSCLDQEEYNLHKNSDRYGGASLTARRHIECEGEGGFWVTEIETALLVWRQR